MRYQILTENSRCTFVHQQTNSIIHITAQQLLNLELLSELIVIFKLDCWLFYYNCRYCSTSWETDLNIIGTLTHSGWVMYIWASRLTITDSDNSLFAGWRKAITWTNDRIFLIGALGINFGGILIWIQIFSIKKMHLKVSAIFLQTRGVEGLTCNGSILEAN